MIRTYIWWNSTHRKCKYDTFDVNGWDFRPTKSDQFGASTDSWICLSKFAQKLMLLAFYRFWESFWSDHIENKNLGNLKGEW